MNKHDSFINQIKVSNLKRHSTNSLMPQIAVGKRQKNVKQLDRFAMELDGLLSQFYVMRPYISITMAHDQLKKLMSYPLHHSKMAVNLVNLII